MNNNHLPPILPPLPLDEKQPDGNDTVIGSSIDEADEPPPSYYPVNSTTLIIASAIASLLGILIVMLNGNTRTVGLEPESGLIEPANVTIPASADSPELSTVHHLAAHGVAVTVTPTVTPVAATLAPPTSTPAPTVTPTMTPTPGPYGDANGNPAPAPELYPWADWEWRDHGSHIIAGEAADTAIGRLVIACTIVRDVLRGRDPYNLRTRWYGWKRPGWHDRMAMWNALQMDGCRDIPWYRFVGSKRDYQIWLRGGYIRESDPYDVYGNTVAVE